jgi:hypothetical protein
MVSKALWAMASPGPAAISSRLQRARVAFFLFDSGRPAGFAL